MTYTINDFIQLDERITLMEDELGHVCVRLLNKNGRFKVTSMAYMGRKLSDEEARRLTRLWNDIGTYLKTLTPNKEEENY